ncbi:MAG: tail fiber domain-containing protein [Bryobacteraceae bacterium]|nr:tail fiber domain-containing protein [Bryobacteraceae bacterium]
MIVAALVLSSLTPAKAEAFSLRSFFDSLLGSIFGQSEQPDEQTRREDAAPGAELPVFQSTPSNAREDLPVVENPALPLTVQASVLTREEVEKMITSAVSSISFPEPVQYVTNTFITGRSGSADGLASAVGRSTTQLQTNIDNLGSSLQTNIDGLLTSPEISGNAYFSGNVGIGTSTPAGLLHLQGNGGAALYNNTLLQMTADSGQAGFSFDGYRDSPNGNYFLSRQARGTLSAPTVSLEGDRLFSFTTSGYSAALGGFREAAAFRMYVDGEADTAGDTTDMPGRISFWTSPNGSATLAERMTIKNNGNVGISTTAPSAKLAITQSANDSTGGFWISASNNTDFRSVFMNTSGVMSFYGGDTAGTLNTATLNAAGEWVGASDIAYKERIETLGYGLDDLLRLTPRSYFIKGAEDKRIGFIAQELELVVPELVSGEEGSKGISYGNLTALVVKAVQELNEKVSRMAGWLRFDAEERLCVDEVCMTKDQFKQMLLRAGGQPSPEASAAAVGAVQVVPNNAPGAPGNGQQAESAEPTATSRPEIAAGTTSDPEAEVEETATSTPETAPDPSAR